MAPEVGKESECDDEIAADGVRGDKSSKTTTPKHSQEQICGWLHKRARFSQKWRRQWFLVDRNVLRYGNSDKDISKKILLEGGRILESNVDNKLHSFSVQPRSGKRAYYLQAEDEIGRNKWMQAICFAKMANGVEEKGSSCAIL